MQPPRGQGHTAYHLALLYKGYIDLHLHKPPDNLLHIMYEIAML